MIRKRKSSVSLAPGKPRGASAQPITRHRSDHDLDLSELPELTDAQLRRMRRVGRPAQGSAPKQLIAIRLDPDLLATIRKLAARQHIGYQTLIQQLLATGVQKALA